MEEGTGETSSPEDQEPRRTLVFTSERMEDRKKTVSSSELEPYISGERRDSKDGTYHSEDPGDELPGPRNRLRLLRLLLLKRRKSPRDLLDY